MSVAHGLLPPHPAPTALVATFHANLGLTLIYGLIVAVPAIIVAGPLFGRTLAGINARPLPGLAAEPKSEDELPGTFISIATALLPAMLLLLTTIGEFVAPASASPTGSTAGILKFLSDPDAVLIFSLLVRKYLVAGLTGGAVKG